MWKVQVHSDNGPDLEYEVEQGEVRARQFAQEELGDGARRVVIIDPQGRIVDEMLASDYEREV